MIKIELKHVSPQHCIETTLDEGCCQFLRTFSFGRKWVCHLFDVELEDSVGDGTGKLLRCNKCVEEDSDA